MWGFVLPLREADDCVYLDAESPDLERSLAPPEVVDGSLGVDGGHQRVPIHGALRDVSSCSSVQVQSQERQGALDSLSISLGPVQLTVGLQFERSFGS